jgi:hypothetical protein
MRGEVVGNVEIIGKAVQGYESWSGALIVPDIQRPLTLVYAMFFELSF